MPLRPGRSGELGLACLPSSEAADWEPQPSHPHPQYPPLEKKVNGPVPVSIGAVLETASSWSFGGWSRARERGEERLVGRQVEGVTPCMSLSFLGVWVTRVCEHANASEGRTQTHTQLANGRDATPARLFPSPVSCLFQLGRRSFCRR